MNFPLRKQQLLNALFFAILCISSSNAQKRLELSLRTNLGIGAKYETLQFDNADSYGELIYSPGGGIGLELGVGYLLKDHLLTYGAVGYQQNIALQYHSSNYGGTDKTSFFFNKTSLQVGTNYRFKFREKGKFGMLLGGGGSFNLPGKMSITELNFHYGDVTFKPALGLHAETGVFIELKKLILKGSIRLRHLNYKLKNYNQPSDSNTWTTDNYEQFPNYIQKVNASGGDLSFSLIKKFA